jgi:hypothetical protein
VRIISGLRPSGDAWAGGTIYDPDAGVSRSLRVVNGKNGPVLVISGAAPFDVKLPLKKPDHQRLCR